MIPLALVLIGIPMLLAAYSLVGYPFLLLVFARLRPTLPLREDDPAEWPIVSICVPAYNEERSIGHTLDNLLQLDYPVHRRQIVVVSDASTDRTDEIVRSYADRGVELVRLPVRGGKTAAENALIPLVRGEILVNTDATIRILPDSVKHLVRQFQDPTIGVASGRDVSVGNVRTEENAGEAGYVGYEMWVRGLETRIGSIVGASGCFYAIRGDLQDHLFPEALSRDFAAALSAIRAGYRAVSVDDAVCLVPRTVSLHAEYTRKIRTMARGLETLWHLKVLMNPFKYGLSAWMLLSHKLARWLIFLTAPLALIGLDLLAIRIPLMRPVFGAAVLAILIGILAMKWPAGRHPPRFLAPIAFVMVALAAGFVAWTKALRHELNPIWEPTRRPTGS
jgi:cellulose synthase/poly-beta-1,6-N-acetylglucosamine synthase-like glycosyltransferase